MAVVTTTMLVKAGVKVGTTVVKKGLEAAANPEKTGSKLLLFGIILFLPIILVAILTCGVFSGVNGYVSQTMDDFMESELNTKIESANLFFEIKEENVAREKAFAMLPLPEEEKEIAKEEVLETVELTEADKDALFAENHISFDIEAPNLAYTLAYVTHTEEGNVRSKWGNVFQLDADDQESVSFLMIMDFYEDITVPRTKTYTDESGNECTEYYLSYMSPQEIALRYWPDDSATQEMFIVSYQQYCITYDIPEVIYEMVDGRMNVPAYYQTYNYKPFGGGTISSSGCGPTSLAMCLSYLTGTTISVNEVADWAGNRYYVPGKGQAWSLFPAAAKHWGCEARQTDSSQEVIAALESGCPVIASMGPGHFTSAGHFIVICGTTSDGYLIVNDPNLHNYNHHGDTVPADWVWSEAKGYFILSGGAEDES